MLGDDIEITILENHPHEVKLGINAPRKVVILRKEIHHALMSENREAAKLPGGAESLVGLDSIIKHFREREKKS